MYYATLPTVSSVPVTHMTIKYAQKQLLDTTSMEPHRPNVPPVPPERMEPAHHVPLVPPNHEKAKPRARPSAPTLGVSVMKEHRNARTYVPPEQEQTGAIVWSAPPESSTWASKQPAKIVPLDVHQPLERHRVSMSTEVVQMVRCSSAAH